MRIWNALTLNIMLLIGMIEELLKVSIGNLIKERNNMKLLKKYELTSEVIEYQGHTLHRIKALKDFGSIKAGEFGGWIESEENLSQDGNAWIDDEAMVFANAKVFGDARIFGDAKVFGNANISGNAKVFGNAYVFDYANVFDYARVYNYATIYDNATIYNNAEVYDYAEVYENANVCENAKVYGSTRIFGNVNIFGNATIKGDAKVHNNYDYIVFKNFWSSGRYFTWTRSNNKWSVGCFYGTGDELIEKAYNDNEISGKEYERVVRYVKSILLYNKIKDTLSNKNGKTC